MLWLYILAIALPSAVADEFYNPSVPVRFDRSSINGYLSARSLGEASGMTASRSGKQVLWAINDSGDKPSLYAMDYTGSDLGVFTVRGAENRDWEDLASFYYNGKACLLIADVGDNGAERDHCTLYIVAEPDVEGSPFADVLWHIHFRYPDGPADCESVAVDTNARRAILITKRLFPCVVYSLDLMPEKNKTIRMAKKIGEFDSIPRPTVADVNEDPLYGMFRSQPTALDIDRSGAYAIILTYKNAYLYKKKKTEDWGKAFSRTPVTLEFPQLLQAEAACFGISRRNIFITSEKRFAPLIRLNFRE